MVELRVDADAVDEDAAVTGARFGTATNWDMGEAARLRAISPCFLPFIWLTSAASPMLLTSKSFLHSVQDALPVELGTEAIHDEKRSSFLQTSWKRQPGIFQTVQNKSEKEWNGG